MTDQYQPRDDGDQVQRQAGDPADGGRDPGAVSGQQSGAAPAGDGTAPAVPLHGPEAPPEQGATWAGGSGDRLPDGHDNPGAAPLHGPETPAEGGATFTGGAGEPVPEGHDNPPATPLHGSETPATP